MNMKPIAVDHTAEEAKECIGIAEQALEDATNSDIFICGMQPLDEGSPWLHAMIYSSVTLV